MLIQRTTLKLNQDIYKAAKKRAIDEEMDFQELVNKALSRYLDQEKKSKKMGFRFADFDLGGLKSKLDRKTIYGKRKSLV